MHANDANHIAFAMVHEPPAFSDDTGQLLSGEPDAGPVAARSRDVFPLMIRVRSVIFAHCAPGRGPN